MKPDDFGFNNNTGKIVIKRVTVSSLKKAATLLLAATHKPC